MINLTRRVRKTITALIGVFILALIPFSAIAQRQEPFAIVSDTHIRTGNYSVYSSFLRLMEQEKINMIIHTGDAIDSPGELRQWAKFLELTGPDKTLHLAPGNHDISGRRSLSVYLRFFPKTYYSFSEGDTLFVLLNTELPGEKASITGEQLAWLRTEIGKSFKYKFVFLHEPLYPIIAGHGLDRHPKARDDLHHLFVTHGVSLVVSGHDHLYGRTIKDGILYVTAATLGGWLPFGSKDYEAFRYIVAERNESGYSFRVIDMEGATRDQFVVGR
ncbi:MAG TPA: metallophosphoesterase [Syntrophorhabdaceae bacterium]|nr:metallophosphoesterase [Syntrophorhabdaceae bacterium]